MKATAIAPSNIAFIKYWGKKDESLRIPMNGSVSMNLSNLLTTTTVEFSPDFKEDVITINEDMPNYSSSEKRSDESRSSRQDGYQMVTRQARTISFKRVVAHLDRIRSLAKVNYRAIVISKNNFPTGTGLSSSASGFAALTLAASNAASLKLSKKELSVLARQGSGSACRSISNGFVEWFPGATNETSYSLSLYPPEYWNIVDVVAIVSKNKKEIPTTEGQKLAKSSPFLPVRLERIKEKINSIKKYMKEKNFQKFGELLEAEALELHAIMLTSTPSLVYWLPGTLRVMHAVNKWRKQGLEVYFTVNTGQDIHLICKKHDANKVARKASGLPEVTKTIINYPSEGAHLIPNNLF